MVPFPTHSLRPAFRALARCFVPETAHATESQWETLELTVALALGERPPAIRRQVVLFIRVLDGAARLRWGRGLGRLAADRCTRLVTGFATSPMLLFRRGVSGLRTLVMLGWYTQPGVTAGLGYRAHPAGWDARR